MYQPLADALRPQNLDDVCGQSHILGENGLLRRIIDSGKIPNMIFYGPSGTGKTTVANIIAQRTHRKLCKLNATTASSGDIKEIYAQLDTFLAPNGVLLYLDEIQYFNKKQQQTLLEYIENGKITLIASTTENPYFYVYNAILSRSTVFEFKPVPADEAEKAIARAVRALEQQNGVKAKIEDGVVSYVAQACGGDIRKAMNAVELLFSAPFLWGYLIWLGERGEGHFLAGGAYMDLLLIGCGFVSAIPQLGLSLGIRSVPMISLGIMQYILPTTVFMLGAFVMREPISASKLLVFLFIWVGVGCFLSGTVFSTGRKSSGR